MANSDSYRPADRGSRESYRPQPGPRDRDDRYRNDNSSMYRFGGDSYYPPADDPYSSRMYGSGAARRDHRDDFTFQSGQAHAQNHPPSDDVASRRPHRAHGRKQARREAGIQHGGRPYGRKQVAPHERPLFQPRGTTPEQMDGMNEGPIKFLSMEDLSTSDGEMSMPDLASEEGEAPAHKKSRIVAKEEIDAKSVPKWSNPDPYTVLPPDDPNKKKRKDIVQLIRKAKISAAEAIANTNAVTDNDDFISLDEPDEAPQVVPTGPSIPTGPSSFSHRNHLHPARTPRAPGSSVIHENARSLGPPPSLPNKPIPPPPPGSPPPPPPPVIGSLNQFGSARAKTPPDWFQKRIVRHELPPVTFPPDNDPAYIQKDILTHEEFQAPRVPSVRQQAQKYNKRKRPQTKLGDVVSEWVSAAPSGTPAAWTVVDHSRTEEVGHWHSLEIWDFYHFVKPQEFESAVRHSLYKRVEACLMRSRELPDGSLHCFGSYAAGLYLPTADMDLVYVSRRHLEGGPAIIHPGEGRLLFKIERELQNANLATSCEVIRHAKVPLIKFVDRETGIKVDISFEKVDGITTQTSFEEWKKKFPIMPVLVTLVKQFLLMRGLSEVRDGGIGGFSVICLVVHMLSMHPGIQSGTLDQNEHVGELFMEFLQLYGKKFNIQKCIISMDPPIYLKKGRYGPGGRLSKPDQLTIIDPHQEDNDISGGSHHAKYIFSLFAQAHDDLQGRMAELQTNRTKFGSILEVIFKGNYSIYLEQRAHLKRLYDESLERQPRGYSTRGYSIEGRANTARPVLDY